MDYTHISDNLYKQSYIRPNGKPANRYFIKNNCNTCNKEFFQYRTNWQRSEGIGYCSKTCKGVSQKSPEGSKKLKSLLNHMQNIDEIKSLILKIDNLS